MPLLLLDLDDTLIDRTATLRTWATGFLGAVDAPQSDLDWLLDRDAGAPSSLDEFARGLKTRYGLSGTVDDVATAVVEGIASGTIVQPAERAAVRAAKEAGWTTVIVTNGATATQERKIRVSGLDALVDGWVVSEEADVWKPDRLIFELAAVRAGEPLAGAWMIGDNPVADIAGAGNAGISSIWLHHGREWPEHGYQPTAVADSCAQAIHLVLASKR